MCPKGANSMACLSLALERPWLALASYPGLLAPAFVACSTNVGKAWYNWVTWYDIPGRVEEWHIPGKTASK